MFFFSYFLPQITIQNQKAEWAAIQATTLLETIDKRTYQHVTLRNHIRSTGLEWSAKDNWEA